MSLVSPTQVSDGTTADASDVNTPINQLAAVINGNIDNSNIVAGAAIDGSKLANSSIDIGAKASVFDGWVGVTDSWTYASATTVTVPSDATTKYAPGDKVKFSNGSTKYFTIQTVASTLLTFTGGSDTVANSAISAIYYSKVDTPQTFPGPANPYKFSAYRTAAHTSSSSFALVQHDTELFDTNSNFDTVTNKGRYTAPVNGFYWFTALAGNSAATGIPINSALYKNGSLNIQGSYTVPGTAPTLSVVTGILQLTAGDYVEHYFIGGAGSAMYAGLGVCYFHGFLICRT